MCKVQWLANDHGGVNRTPFTERDYEKLVDAVESVQSATQEDLFDEAPIDWQAVADIVGVSPALLLLLLLASFHLCRRYARMVESPSTASRRTEAEADRRPRVSSGQKQWTTSC
jgi:hypothetical protein